MFEHAPKLLRPRKASQVSVVSKARRATGALLAALCLTCGSAAYANSSATPQTHTVPVAAKRMAARYATIPLSFEANQGQTDPSVQFLSRGSGYSMFLTRDEVVLNLERQQSASPTPGQTQVAPPVDTLRMKLVGANAATAITGADPLTGVVSYFIGNDPKKWHADIQTYGRVDYAQVYPGVDLVFYGNQRQLEYDFVVAPGADASRIAWKIEGASPAIDAEGNLILSAANGPASFKKPVLYQMDSDKKIAVDGSFSVAGNKIGFRLGRYDHSKPLIIDPVLSYASYLGGSALDTIGNAIGDDGGSFNYTQGLAIDSAGSAYVTGTTYSTDFPVENPFQSTNNVTPSNSRAPTTFVTKFSPNGTSLAYSTYLGGSGADYAYAIAVDSNGNAYVTGQTFSNDFPITSGAYNPFCAGGPKGGPSPNPEISTCSPAGPNSAYVTKLNATGTALVYSTFLGGYGSQYGVGIAVDAAGRAYVAGVSGTSCDDGTPTDPAGPYPYTCFPTTTGAVIGGTTPNGGDAPQYSFISVFDPTGADLLYSTLFGDKNGSSGQNGAGFTTGVNIDSSGNFYLVGWTGSPNLPTTAGVIQPTGGPLRTGDPTNLASTRSFIAKFSPVTATGGASLAYATYLGGQMANENDRANAIAVDSDGNSYVTGFTDSQDFPVTKGSYQTTCDSGNDNCFADFVVKLNSTATVLDWGTYVGDLTGSGDSIEGIGQIALDGKGNVYVSGIVGGSNFPQVNPVEPISGFQGETFVSELDPTGKNLLFSTAIYSPSFNQTAGLAVDATGDIYLAGNIDSTGLLVTPGAFQQTYAGGGAGAYGDGFVLKIAAQGTATAALVATPSPVSAGQTATLTATVTPTEKYASVPTGTIEFQDGSTTLNTATLNSSGVATYATSTLAPGKHSLTAVYSGDSTYPTVNGTTTLTVNGLTATVAVTPASSSISAASSLSVKVAVTGSGTTPTGTVTLLGGSYTSTAETLSSGAYTFTIPANSFTAGTDMISVTYSGDSNYGTATGTAKVTVTAVSLAATTTTLSSSSLTSNQGSSVTFTAAVSSSVSGSITGTVTFYDGTTTLGTGTLASGAATFSTSSLSLGTHSITATFGGDTLYLTSTSSPLSQVVVTPSIAFTANPTTLTVAKGSSGTVVITATPTGDYTGTVNFSCGTLPADASCTFAPPTLTFTASSSAQTSTLTFSTKATTSAALTHGPGKIYAPGILAALLLLPLSFRKRLRKLSASRVWTASLLLVFALAGTAGLLGITGCGGSGPANTTPAGMYTVPVTIAVGSSSSTLNVTVIVQ